MPAGAPQPSLAALPVPGNEVKEPAGQTALSQHVLFAAGIPGQRVCPEPGACPALPCRARAIPARGLCLQPRGERRPRGLRACPALPRSVCRRGRAGKGPRRQARGAALGPLIAPGRSVGAAASRASPAPSRCWRWARGRRRRGGTAPAPLPGRDGPRCWRGNPGWTGRRSARRRTLRRGEEGTGRRYRGPRCRPKPGERARPPLPPGRAPSGRVGSGLPWAISAQ